MHIDKVMMVVKVTSFLHQAFVIMCSTALLLLLKHILIER
jgi:hypothetical protein